MTHAGKDWRNFSGSADSKQPGTRVAKLDVGSDSDTCTSRSARYT